MTSSEIELPKGFLSGGINCGVRKYRPDLGLVFSETNCVAAGVFTSNSMKGAHVVYCQEILPATDVRAVIVNSGQANAATGDFGLIDNFEITKRVALNLSIEPRQVLTSSTGVIGVRVPLERVLPGIDTLVDQLQSTVNRFGLSIMTTDLVPKFAIKKVMLSTGEISIVGVAKGSGMIHPNMATMLGYVFTDVEIEKSSLIELTRRAADNSFNMISVDGETSPCDSVFVLANGASGFKAKTPEDLSLFSEGLQEICKSLAIQIAKDGEGATKLITVNVFNAHDLAEARIAARMITTSPLIKSAIHGEDPNWGRILSRLGQAGVREESFKILTVWLQNMKVYEKGGPSDVPRSQIKEKLKSESIVIDVDLASGDFSATAWGCDLTMKYVEINSDYT